MTTTSSFISGSATLALFVPSFLLAACVLISCVLIADFCLVGMAASSVASRLLPGRALHRSHTDLLLRRVRRSIIREILANAPAVGSKSIDNRRVGRQRQHHIQHIVSERASIEAGH